MGIRSISQAAIEWPKMDYRLGIKKPSSFTNMLGSSNRVKTETTFSQN